MAFTKQKRNLTSPNAVGEPWIEQGFTDDCSTATELKAGVAGTQHFIRGWHIHHIPGTTPKTVNLQDDNQRLITPEVNVVDYAPHLEEKYGVPMPCEVGHGIWVKAESSGDLAIVMEGFSRQVDPFELKTGIIVASGSPSASVSSTPSASISSSPSASLSVSASISASASSTPSVSASISASISSTPSVSTSISTSVSASLSASPSYSG